MTRYIDVVCHASAVHHTKNFGDFGIHVFGHGVDKECLVLTRGALESAENVLCRVSQECMPGTALNSAECDCREEIEYSLKKMSEANKGILVYLLGEEGRGHGIAHKIRALANKNKGHDTFTAIEAMGDEIDITDFSVIKPILDFFKIRSISCLSNSPDKIKKLEQSGVVIESIANIPVTPNEISRRHLLAKKSRGHSISFTKGDCQNEN